MDNNENKNIDVADNIESVNYKVANMQQHIVAIEHYAAEAAKSAAVTAACLRMLALSVLLMMILGAITAVAWAINTSLGAIAAITAVIAYMIGVIAKYTDIPKR